MHSSKQATELLNHLIDKVIINAGKDIGLDVFSNCKTCDYKINNPDSGWCYMFKEKMDGCKIWKKPSNLREL